MNAAGTEQRAVVRCSVRFLVAGHECNEDIYHRMCVDSAYGKRCLGRTAVKTGENVSMKGRKSPQLWNAFCKQRVVVNEFAVDTHIISSNENNSNAMAAASERLLPFYFNYHGRLLIHFLPQKGTINSAQYCSTITRFR
ncbi:hypothetical protein NPIL_74061 [Nephila pilipes]|uniref:Uncharacterized protein n=1 Tax=Nephila pilipes TaxID=299642 RepID=A0A8X6TVS2_NEPPI|nr:hypothetical protein NPIL_74061 [Nephila pilipes]